MVSEVQFHPISTAVPGARPAGLSHRPCRHTDQSVDTVKALSSHPKTVRHPKRYKVVVWNMAFIFPNSWDDDPVRLSYFSGGLKPPIR